MVSATSAARIPRNRRISRSELIELGGEKRLRGQPHAQAGCVEESRASPYDITLIFVMFLRAFRTIWARQRCPNLPMVTWNKHFDAKAIVFKNRLREGRLFSSGPFRGIGNVFIFRFQRNDTKVSRNSFLAPNRIPNRRNSKKVKQ